MRQQHAVERSLTSKSFIRGSGIAAAGDATVYLSGTAVLGNATGLSGSKINSYGDNLVAGNCTNGTFGAIVKKDERQW